MAAIPENPDEAVIERSVEWVTYANIPKHPSGWGPVVKGKCPTCGLASLFLGEGGYVTCASLECRNPCAADGLLHGEGDR